MARPRRVTVTTSPTRLCVKNLARKGLRIQNIDASNTVYLGGSSVQASGEKQGMQLLAGQLISWNKEDEDVTYAWYGIVGAGTANVIVTEVF